jgi:hypothetical protein
LLDLSRAYTLGPWKLSELGVLRPLASANVGNITYRTVGSWIHLSREIFFSNVKGSQMKKVRLNKSVKRSETVKDSTKFLNSATILASEH